MVAGQMASTLQSGVAGLLCDEEGGVRMEGHHQYGDGDGWGGRGLPIPINPGFQLNNTCHLASPEATEAHRVGDVSRLNIRSSFGDLRAHSVVSPSGGNRKNERGITCDVAHTSVHRLTLLNPRRSAASS